MDRTTLFPTKVSGVSVGFSRFGSRCFKRVTGSLGGLLVRRGARSGGIIRGDWFALRRLREGWPE
jgi:hypothetical protein